LKITLYLYYFFRSVLLRGLFNTLSLLRAEALYERKFGIKTATIKKSDSAEFFHYQGASYKVILRLLSEILEETKTFDFVDIGCGKGRVLFVAEYCGYKRLTGIELDEELINEAETNLQQYKLRKNSSEIHFAHQNALDYCYEDEPTVYFLFNPFNESVLGKVLDKIRYSTTSETWIIYMNPMYPRPFEQRGISCFKEIKTRFYKEAFIYKIEGLK